MSSGQKNTAINAAQNAALLGYGNQQQSYNSANRGYQQELASPGFTPAEQQGITQATTGSLAGAFGAAQQRLNDQAARTGNTAGVNATEEELAREQARQNAQALGGLQEQFGLARIQGTQNALGGESGLANSQANAANQAQRNALSGATTPGFWSRVGQSALAGLGSAIGLGRPCWIAEALYGAASPQADLLRWYLNDVWRRSSRQARRWMWAYRVFGRPAAWCVRHFAFARRLAAPHFAHALVRARQQRARQAQAPPAAVRAGERQAPPRRPQGRAARRRLAPPLEK